MLKPWKLSYLPTLRKTCEHYGIIKRFRLFDLQKTLDKQAGICEDREPSVCGYSSVVERNLAKVDVARSNRVTRFQD